MLICTLESRTNQSLLFRAHVELSVLGYNPVPRKLDTVSLTSQLSFLVFLCCFVHYIVIRLLRRSSLDAPCSCPARCRMHPVPATESTIELEEKSGADRSDSLNAALKADISNLRASEGGGNEMQSGFSSPVEDLADLAQQDIANDQDVKDWDLLDALQRERETVAELYSELEQERNFSATAASEAMAMISRVQEEKAAVQMEARQFERMVVEKAMYDQEAMEALNELLVSREQEKISLESEIRVYKEKLDAITREKRQLLLLEVKANEGKVFPKLESPFLVQNEKINAASRAGREEESKYVDKGNIINSQLLSPLGQDGSRGMEARLGRRLSSGIRMKAEKFEEKDGGEPEFPEKIYTALSAGREEFKYIDKASTASNQLLNTRVQDGARGKEAHSGRRPSSAIRNIEGKSEKVDDGKPEIPKKIDTGIRTGRDEQLKYVDKVSSTSSQLLTALGQGGGRLMEVQLGLRAPSAYSSGGNSEDINGSKSEVPENINIALKVDLDEPSKYVDKVSTANSQLVAANVQDEGRVTEAQFGVRAPISISKNGGKPEEADDGKPPGFVSLKRRWGSQEITLKTLDQTKEQRRIGDKKSLSVLEYVLKFEKQQQYGVRLAVQMPSVTKLPQSAGEFRSKFRSDGVDDRAASVTSGADEPTSKGFTGDYHFRGGRSNEEEDYSEEKMVNALLLVEEVENGSRCDERPSCMSADGNESRAGKVCKDTDDAEECGEESVFVHHVYEV